MCLVFAIFATLGAYSHGPFNGHKVIRVTPQTQDQLHILSKLLSQSEGLDLWRAPSTVNRSVDIRLNPFQYDDVTNSLQQMGFRTTVMIEDIQEVLDEQNAARSKKIRSQDPFDYSKYHELTDINSWMTDMANTYKDMVTMFNVTQSYEGRQMMGIKISTGTAKQAFFIEGGIHAREWITPATVIYMAGQMLEKYKFDQDLTAMVDNFDWYILPVTNPDGYAYTWTGDKARMWRKTRSKHGLCYGADPNRNWDMEWCKEGASKDPCSDTYCGPKAFSEVEVKGVADFLSKIENLRGFIDFHSYSQLWMSPWGYTTKLPDDFKLQDQGSTVAVEALEKLYGTQYEHGSIANTIYVASGSSADWTYGKINVKYSYGVELRDQGKYGFLLPDDQILPSGKETLAALVALAEFVHNN